MVWLLYALLVSAKDPIDQREVDLSWREHEQARAYLLEVAINPVMDPVLWSRKLENAHVTLKLKPGVYYFRVRGISEKNIPGPWTDPEPFVVNASPPRPLSPEAGQTISQLSANTTLVFQWEGHLRNKETLIEISDESGVLLKRSVTGSRFEWTPPNPGRMKWRVGYPTVTREEWGPLHDFVIASSAIPEVPFSFMDEGTLPMEVGLRVGATLQNFSGTNRDTLVSLAPSVGSSPSMDLVFRRTLARPNVDSWRGVASLGVGISSVLFSAQTLGLARIEAEFGIDKLRGKYRWGPWARVGARQSLLIVPISDVPLQINVLKIFRLRTLFGGRASGQLGRRLQVEAQFGLGFDGGGGDSSLSSSPGIDLAYTGEISVKYELQPGFDLSLGVGVSRESTTWTATNGQKNFFSIDQVGGRVNAQFRF